MKTLLAGVILATATEPSGDRVARRAGEYCGGKCDGSVIVLQAAARRLDVTTGRVVSPGVVVSEGGTDCRYAGAGSRDKS